MSNLLNDTLHLLTGIAFGALCSYVLTQNHNYNIRLDLNFIPPPSNDTCEVNYDINLEEDDDEELVDTDETAEDNIEELIEELKQE